MPTTRQGSGCWGDCRPPEDHLPAASPGLLWRSRIHHHNLAVCEWGPQGMHQDQRLNCRVGLTANPTFKVQTLRADSSRTLDVRVHMEGTPQALTQLQPPAAARARAERERHVRAQPLQRGRHPLTHPFVLLPSPPICLLHRTLSPSIQPSSQHPSVQGSFLLLIRVL